MLRLRTVVAVLAVVAVASLLWVGLGSPTVYASDGPIRVRDPFASRPVGPFSLLTNPAAVVEEKALGVHLGFQPGDHDGPIRFLGYSDPGDALFAAGAFVWLEGGKAADSKWRQLSYHIGRFLTGHVAVGAAVKHIASPEGQRWAGDLGLYAPFQQNWIAALVYYNAFGGTDLDPEELVASISYISREGWGFSVEMGTPLSSSHMSPIVAWVLDLPVGSNAMLRAGHRRYLDSDAGTEWLGALRWDFGSFLLDAGVVWPHEGVAIYRIGVTLPF